MGNEELRLPGREYALLGLAALVVLIAHALGAFLAYTQPVYDHATGSWFVLAYDILNGTLYRPFESDAGIGGSRLFPLYPLLIAGLVRLGLDYVGAGLLINLASWISAVGGAYVLLRQLEVQRMLAGVFAVFAVGSFGTLMTMTAVRGDLLPVAFVLWGVVASLRARSGGRLFLAAAAVLFTLGMAAKVTALVWPLAVVLYFAVTGRTRHAAILSGMLALGGAAFVLVVQHASEGRFIDMMLVTSDGGGGLLRFLRGPIYLEMMARGADPLCYLATGAGLFLLVTRFRKLGSSLVAILLLSVTVMTAAIFGSRGTIQNHLIDINLAAMLFVATRYLDIRAKPNLIPLVLLFYALVIPGRYDYQYHQDWDHGFRTEAENHLRSIDGPVLSEHPGIPLAIGRHPFLADAFMVSNLEHKRPEIHARLQAELEARTFDAVILSHVGEVGWYEEIHFGGRIRELIDEHYVRDRNFGRYVFFRPKSEAEPEPKPRAPDEA